MLRFGGAEGEDAVFEGNDAVEPPGDAGDGFDQVGFDGAFGAVFVDVPGDVELVVLTSQIVSGVLRVVFVDFVC